MKYEYVIKDKLDEFENTKMIKYRKIWLFRIKQKEWSVKPALFAIFNDSNMTEKDINGFLDFIRKQEKTEMLGDIEKELHYLLERLKGELCPETERYASLRDKIRERWYELNKPYSD